MDISHGRGGCVIRTRAVLRLGTMRAVTEARAGPGAESNLFAILQRDDASGTGRIDEDAPFAAVPRLAA